MNHLIEWPVLQRDGIGPWYLDCPACEGSYPEGTVCECGYCDHAGVIAGTCPRCGAELVPSLADLVEDLLDAADQVLTEIAGGWEPPAMPRLRRIVTHLQGLAGVRVVAHPTGQGSTPAM